MHVEPQARNQQRKLGLFRTVWREILQPGRAQEKIPRANADKGEEQLKVEMAPGVGIANGQDG